MHFEELLSCRQSCRNFDENRAVEEEKLLSVLNAARLSPSACNGQPYHVTVCTGDTARRVAKATQKLGMNKFSSKAPIQLVISESHYVRSAALGAKVKGNDYRSIDIGIAAGYMALAATEVGLSTCILGWFEDGEIRDICGLDSPVRLVVSLGYAAEDDRLRDKKRKLLDELVSYKD